MTKKELNRAAELKAALIEVGLDSPDFSYTFGTGIRATGKLSVALEKAIALQREARRLFGGKADATYCGAGTPISIIEKAMRFKKAFKNDTVFNAVLIEILY